MQWRPLIPRPRLAVIPGLVFARAYSLNLQAVRVFDCSAKAPLVPGTALRGSNSSQLPCYLCWQDGEIDMRRKAIVADRTAVMEMGVADDVVEHDKWATTLALGDRVLQGDFR